MKVYFDSVIWINYIWGQIEPDGRSRKYLIDLINFINENDIQVIKPLFVDTEISSHFREWYILKRIIKEGYGHRELRGKVKEKKNDLRKKEKEDINKFIEDISELEYVEAIKLSGLTIEDLDLFQEITLNYHVDYMDAFHVIAASIEKCRYIVTKDEAFRRAMNKFLNDNNLKGTLEVLKPKEFLSRSS